MWRKVIYDRENKEPYMVRYSLISTRWVPNCLGQWAHFLSFRLCLHHILKGDDDKHLHDHPWPWAAFILKGWYWEELIDYQFHNNYSYLNIIRGLFSFRIGRSTTWHKLTLNDGPVWSLFWMGPRVQEWGFLVDGTKIQWKEYLNV